MIFQDHSVKRKVVVNVNVNVNVKTVGGGGPLPQKHVVCVMLAVYIVHYRRYSPGRPELTKMQ